jgi:predicted adenine nucleotide alpha hydrolase (AANH) superfamily ATPase
MCCANCSLYPLKSLLTKGIEAKGLWFNPNIHPLPEYQERLRALGDLQKMWGLDIEYHDRYGQEEFVRQIGDPRDDRCIRCYAMRLEETARNARKMNLDGFTTTLLVSPYQQFDAIVGIGRELGRRYSVPFYVEDFRRGYRDSIPLSRELGLYRQKYCGCLYSAQERKVRRENG